MLRKTLALIVLLGFFTTLVGCDAGGKVDKHGADVHVDTK